jgi:hypothetical protein
MDLKRETTSQLMLRRSGEHSILSDRRRMRFENSVDRSTSQIAVGLIALSIPPMLTARFRHSAESTIKAEAKPQTPPPRGDTDGPDRESARPPHRPR